MWLWHQPVEADRILVDRLERPVTVVGRAGLWWRSDESVRSTGSRSRVRVLNSSPSSSRRAEGEVARHDADHLATDCVALEQPADQERRPRASADGRRGPSASPAATSVLSGRSPRCLNWRFSPDEQARARGLLHVGEEEPGHPARVSVTPLRLAALRRTARQRLERPSAHPSSATTSAVRSPPGWAWRPTGTKAPRPPARRR